MAHWQISLFDKPDPLDGPFFEETIYVTPSRLSAAVQDQIASCTADVARAPGFDMDRCMREPRVRSKAHGPGDAPRARLVVSVRVPCTLVTRCL